MKELANEVLGDNSSKIDLSQFKGEYVATKSMFNDEIIAHGEDYEEVYKKASVNIENPMVFFVPRKMASVFTCK